MKTVFKWVVLLMLVFAGCQKPASGDYQSLGIITGVDARACACCGGWYILIDNTTYEFETLPAGAGIDIMNATFPLAVKLNWQLSPKPACPDKKIDILKIAKQ